MANLAVPVTADDHSVGNEDAAITLVEYGDYQCPDCGMAFPVVKKLQRHFGDRLRLVYRNFPLTEMHEFAEPAAEAAEFAAAKGRFWEMHDAIFLHQRRLSVEFLIQQAEELGLDGGEAQSAIENQEYGERIARDVEGGERSGVHGTPTFFINGVEYQGDWEFEYLAAAIEEA